MSEPASTSATPSPRTPSRQPRQAARRGSRIWVFLSIVLSLAIMGWAFTLPFRNGREMLVSSDDRDTVASTEGGESDPRTLSAEAYRAAALEMEEKFMKARRERTRLKVVPGRAEVRQRWQRRVERVRSHVRELGDPPEGTLEWHEKNELIESLSDAPL